MEVNILGSAIKDETELKKYLDGFESQLENLAASSNAASYSQYAGKDALVGNDLESDGPV